MNTNQLLVSLAVLAALGSPTLASAQAVSAPDGWVSLPANEYRALRDRANPPTPAPTGASADAVLTRVDYELRGEGDAVSGRANLTVDVLRDGWTQLPIPAGLMARAATLDGQPVSIVGDQPPRVLLSRAGRAVLSLDIALPLQTTAGAESISLPASAAPISRVTLSLPRVGVELSTSAFVAEQIEADGQTRWTLYGQPQQPLNVSWKRRADERRAEQPLRIRAKVFELVGLAEDSGQVTTAVRVEVVQGLAREVVVAVPPSLVVNTVDGPTVADWTLSNDLLYVRLLDPAAGEVALVVQAETRVPREGSLAIPLVRVPSAERETGGVVLDVVGAGELSEHLERGLEPADPAELGELVAGRESPSMAGFRYRAAVGTEPRSLDVNIVRYTPQAVLIATVQRARFRALVSEDGRVLVEASYAVRNNQRSFLKVTLPSDGTLWSASVAGRPVRPGVAEESGVLLPLDKGRPGEETPIFVVSLTYVQRVDAWDRSGRSTLTLPKVDLEIARTDVELRYSPRFTVDRAPGTFRVELSPPPFEMPYLSPAAAPAAPPAPRDAASGGLQALADRFKNESGGRTVIGSLPVQPEFPAFGSAMFLAAELTKEDQAPVVEFMYRRTGN